MCILAPGTTRWRFLAAQQSHAHTEAAHYDFSGMQLTGIPEGRQIWYFDQDAEPLKPVYDEDNGDASDMAMPFSASENPNSADLLFRARQTEKWVEEGNALPDRRKRPENVLDAARKATAFYEMLQCDDGHFAGDYGGPHFLMPGLIVVWCVAYIVASAVLRVRGSMFMRMNTPEQCDARNTRIVNAHASAPTCAFPWRATSCHENTPGTLQDAPRSFCQLHTAARCLTTCAATNRRMVDGALILRVRPR